MESTTSQNEQRDLFVYLAMLGKSPRSAAVHHTTVTIAEVVGQRDELGPDEIWKKYFLPPLKRDGFASEVDYVSKLYAKEDTLNNFYERIQDSHTIAPNPDLTLIDSVRFDSPQAACASIPNCTGWWRFTRVGYNRAETEAVLHSDYEHPEYGLMGVGQFALLHRERGSWNLSATHMTWVS